MGQTHTNISILADENYLKAVRAVAGTKGMTIGEFTRSAIDSVYGAEVAPYCEKFASSGERNIQLEREHASK